MKTRKGPLDAMFKSKTKIVRRSQVRAVAAGESKNEVAE